MNMEGNKVTTRQMLPSDIQAVVELQGRVFPRMLRWTEGELTKHLSVFAEGQLVAVRARKHDRFRELIDH